MGDPRLSIIPAAAITDRRLEPRDLQVLCLLGRHIDDKGWCRRSQVKIAKELGCGRATVQRSLARLADAGYVQKRLHPRDSGADGAHDYRVILDVAEMDPLPAGEDSSPVGTDQAVENPQGGVPIYGQGCPPMDGQGVPTHERAPMLTTPVERRERERASAGDRDGENPKEARPETRRTAGTGDRTGDFVDSDLFWRGKSRWPGKMGGNLPLEIRAWEALGGHDERVLAERSIEAVVDDAKKQAGRTKWPSWLTYLKTRDWRLLAPDRRDPPAAPFVRTWSKEWWALIFRLTDRGDRLEPIAGSLRRQADGPAGLRWPRDDLPGADAAAALQPVHSGALEAWAWARWLNERGLRLDVGGKTEFWLHLPGAWPPGMDREAALAAKARADAAPKISAETAERLAALGLKPLTRPGLAPGDGAEILCDDGDGPRWLEVTVETADDRVIVGRDARGLRRTAPTQDPDRWRRTHDPGRGAA